MADYAAVQDIIDLKRPLTIDEQERAAAIIPIVCSCLRYEAEKVGKDLDAMIEETPALSDAAKSVTVDITMRELMTSTKQEPVSQYSESALGYTVSGTYLVPGGGIFIKKTELARLGLRRQRYGVLEFYGTE